MTQEEKGVLSLVLGIIALIIFCFVATCTVSCQSAETLPSLETVGDGADIGIKTSQTANNPWPWLIAVIAMPVLFLAYLYFSKSFVGFGRR